MTTALSFSVSNKVENMMLDSCPPVQVLKQIYIAIRRPKEVGTKQAGSHKERRKTKRT